MRSRVFFAEAKNGEEIDSIGKKTRWLLRNAGIGDIVKKDALVAIKISFGEEGNTGHIDARHARLAADEVVALKGKPFFADTNTLYKGRRMNSVDHLNLAREHGFTGEVCGAPVIIADGLRSAEGFDVRIDKKHFKSVRIARAFADADSMIVLSHLTGHMVTGFGSSLKNIGMGCATRSGKLRQHSAIKPGVNDNKCVACGLCVERCPAGAIELKKTARIDDKKCIGCADCLTACRSDAIRISWSESNENVQEKMAEFALGVVKNKKGKIMFVNYAFRITKECDCLAGDDPAIAPDIGIFASTDPVALDKAACDTLNSAAGRDVFKKEWSSIDWTVQLRHAEEIGLGNLDYEIVEMR